MMNIQNNMNISPRLRGRGKKIAAAAVIVLAVIIIASTCVVSIPTGFTGVVTNFGKVTGRTLDPGIHLKAPWQSTVKMDTRIQVKTVDLSCFSSDIQEVMINYALNIQIASHDTKTIYSTIGTDY